mmetsp:Transcript_45203/g.96116  ORF Transcript_45203/g.96116 Transcript_45203/m.96116 type:complete len:206 (-) Transcript_45203:468-1085(-)
MSRNSGSDRISSLPFAVSFAHAAKLGSALGRPSRRVLLAAFAAGWRLWDVHFTGVHTIADHLNGSRRPQGRRSDRLGWWTLDFSGGRQLGLWRFFHYEVRAVPPVCPRKLRWPVCTIGSGWAHARGQPTAWQRGNECQPCFAHNLPVYATPYCIIHEDEEALLDRTTMGRRREAAVKLQRHLRKRFAVWAPPVFSAHLLLERRIV